jgi:hypothetical protein
LAPSSKIPNILSVITNALIEAEWLAQGEQPEAQDAQFVLGKINDELDQWAADERYVYAKGFQLFTLVPELSPHTIGPATGATFTLPSRPVRIDGCTIVIANSDGTSTDIPIDCTRDADWWNSVRIKDLESQIPTDLYYEPDVPNGSLYFWPVPNFNYGARLEWWQIVQQFLTVQDPLVLPPAYRKAITLTIAEQLSGPRSQDQKLAANAAAARAAIWQNNAQSPSMSTLAAGMPSSQSHTRFNFLDGTPW